MKRNMNLVREIMRDLAESSGPLNAAMACWPGHDFAEVAYHFELIVEAELAYGNISKDWGGNAVSATLTGLTWEGNDFLDAVADDRVWGKVMKAVGKGTGAAAFDTVKALAVKFGTEFLMSQI